MDITLRKLPVNRKWRASCDAWGLPRIKFLLFTRIQYYLIHFWHDAKNKVYNINFSKIFIMVRRPFPADTTRWINVSLTLFHRLRRWNNVELTLVQLFVSAGLLWSLVESTIRWLHLRCQDDIITAMGPRAAEWVLIIIMHILTTTTIISPIKICLAQLGNNISYNNKLWITRWKETKRKLDEGERESEHAKFHGNLMRNHRIF